MEELLTKILNVMPPSLVAAIAIILLIRLHFKIEKTHYHISSIVDKFDKSSIQHSTLIVVVNQLKDILESLQSEVKDVEKKITHNISVDSKNYEIYLMKLDQLKTEITDITKKLEYITILLNPRVTSGLGVKNENDK